MNHSFFRDVSEQWPELGAHGDAIGLLKLSIELEQFVFSGCFGKIFKFHSAEVQLVCFIEPVLHCFLQGHVG